jgi:hypothetical protein
VSLPWFALDTGAILDEQRKRLHKNRPASRIEAAAEISAMHAAGLLQRSTIQGLAATLCWTRSKLRRFIGSWAWELNEHKTNMGLPKWWTPIIEQYQAATATREHQTNTKRTPNDPYARDPYRKKEKESKTQTRGPAREAAPAPAPTPAPEPSAAVAQLYTHWRSHHPREPQQPTPKRQDYLRAILRDCGDLETACTYVGWAHRGTDGWARRLQGRKPWPNQQYIEKLDLLSLSRSIDGRLATARKWADQRRTHPGGDAGVSLADELVSANPALADDPFLLDVAAWAVTPDVA